MKTKILFLIPMLLVLLSTKAQVTAKIIGDSVKVTSTGGLPGELIIENSTRNLSKGFLQNIGNGRTRFNLAIDSAWQIGTNLYLRRGSNVQVIALGGINLDSLYFYADQTDFEVQTSADGVVGQGYKLLLSQYWKDKINATFNSVVISGDSTNRIITFTRTDGTTYSTSFVDNSNSGNGSIVSIKLNTPGVIFSNPVTFSGTNGAWIGSLTLNTQSAYTVFGNHTSGSATPTFGKLPVQSINATGSTYNGTKYLSDDGTWKAVSSGSTTTTTDNALDITSAVLTTKKTPYTITYASTVSYNASNGFNQRIVLSGNVTSFSFSNVQGGDYLALNVVQDATGGRTITWPSSVKWKGGTAPTLTTTGNATDKIMFYYNSITGYYEGVYGLDFK